MLKDRIDCRKNKPGPVNSSGNKRESTFDCKQSQKRAKRMFLSGRGDKVLPRDPGKVERQAEDERADLRELFNEVQMFGELATVINCFDHIAPFSKPSKCLRLLQCPFSIQVGISAP